MVMKKFLLTVFLCLFASSSWAADKVKLCQGNNFFSALSYIAQAKNYYQDEGLDVDISTTPLPKFCQDSLAAGRGDFIIISDAPLTYLAASGEAPIRILARLHTEKNIAVFARKDRGIQSPADLKGKKVAWLPGTPNQIYALRFLEKNHLKLEDIQMVVLQPQAMSQALIGGTIDAFIMFEPWGSNALSQLGDNGVKIYDPSIYPMQVTLQSSIDMAQNHPDLVAKMLRALIKSEKFIAEHHDEAISIIAAGTPSSNMMCPSRMKFSTQRLA